MYNKIINKLENKNIAILGFGMEGKSTYSFIRKYLPSAQLTIIDKNDVSSNELLVGDKFVSFVCGDDYLTKLEGFDLIIKSPGISLKDIDISNFSDSITSQIELLLEVDSKNIIGVTGTKGKSTTSTLIYNVIKEQNDNCFLLGNIGKPPFDVIENFNDDTILVIEMSSHQLEFIKCSPHIGIILNLYEDHLDHAGSLVHYHYNKLNMFKFQSDDDIAIYSLDNNYLRGYINSNNYKSKMYTVTFGNEVNNDTIYSKDRYIYFNNSVIYDGNMKRYLLGDHNLSNIMFVLVVADLLKLDINKATNTINNFKGLEHRLEFVRTFNSVSYYNDTIATIPNATINNIKAIGNVDTLIFGGMDRGIDYSDLISFLGFSGINNLICMPDTGFKIGNILRNNGCKKNIYMVDSLDDAVDIARRVTNQNSSCLLSPAASSYNKFKNFEEKGNYYKNLVKKLK